MILRGEIQGPIQKHYKNNFINFGMFDILNDIKNTNYISGLNCQLENCIDYVCEKIFLLQNSFKIFLYE